MTTATEINWDKVQEVLVDFSKQFLKNAYDMELGIPIELSSRMKNMNGVFWNTGDKGVRKSIRIRMSKTYIENQDWKKVISTMKHELIHYALYSKGLPYKDGEPLFESELRKHGSHSSGTVKYKGKVVQYACTADGCSTVYNKKKRYPNDGKGYTSGCCKAPIKNIGEKII